MMNPGGVIADEAMLFVTDAAPGGAVHHALLHDALGRMGIAAKVHRVVALADHPESGARWQVRVTPCLVLGIGTRRIHLPGDPTRLDPARLDQALSMR